MELYFISLEVNILAWRRDKVGEKMASEEELKKILEVLNLYNKKTKKLLGLDVVRGFPPTGDTARTKVEEQTSFIISPIEGETLDAFILTYRLFIQKRERISIRKLKELYENSLIPKELKNKFNKLRNDLNQFLDGFTNISHNNHTFSRREIQNIFIYGDYSHLEEDKVRILDFWDNIPIFKSIIERGELTFILGVVVFFINEISKLNEETIKYLEKKLKQKQKKGR